MNFHYSHNVKDYTYLPKYDQPEKTKCQNQSQTCHLKQTKSACWHVYAPRGSYMKLQRTEADMFLWISIPTNDVL
jgi:hypothetical protein